MVATHRGEGAWRGDAPGPEVTYASHQIADRESLLRDGRSEVVERSLVDAGGSATVGRFSDTSASAATVPRMPSSPTSQADWATVEGHPPQAVVRQRFHSTPASATKRDSARDMGHAHQRLSSAGASTDAVFSYEADVVHATVARPLRIASALPPDPAGGSGSHPARSFRLRLPVN